MRPGDQERKVLVWNQCPDWLEIRRGPTGASPKQNSERQSQGGGELGGARSSLFAISESCLKGERRQTDYLAVYLADSQASPTSPHRGSGRQSDVSNQQCPPPHSWSSPSPSAQEQGADALPYHSLLPTSKRAKGQSSHKASPSPRLPSPRTSPGKHKLHLLSYFSNRKRGRAGGGEGAGCSGSHRNLDWAGLATGRERGTNKPTWGRISLPTMFPRK